MFRFQPNSTTADGIPKLPPAIPCISIKSALLYLDLLSIYFSTFRMRILPLLIALLWRQIQSSEHPSQLKILILFLSTSFKSSPIVLMFQNLRIKKIYVKRIQINPDHAGRAKAEFRKGINTF